MATARTMIVRVLRFIQPLYQLTLESHLRRRSQCDAAGPTVIDEPQHRSQKQVTDAGMHRHSAVFTVVVPPPESGTVEGRVNVVTEPLRTSPWWPSRRRYEAEALLQVRSAPAISTP